MNKQNHALKFCVFSSLLLLAFFVLAWRESVSRQNRLIIEERYSQKIPIVFSKVKISKYSVVSREMVEERWIPVTKVPGDALWNQDIVIGRKTVRDINPAEMLSSTYHFGLEKMDYELLKRWPTNDLPLRRQKW